MVKTPPCSKYEPPRNIEYHRNGKIYCRISEEGNGYKRLTPPCKQYGNNYVLYKRQGKEFCRKSNKKNGEPSKFKKKTIKKSSPQKIVKNRSKYKVPPCEQYAPPRNIPYKRNGKIYCRIPREGKGPKRLTPPCNQYGDNYILYKRNGKEFCRKTSKKDKEMVNKSLKTKCSNINSTELKKMANILNIDLSKYQDNAWICKNMEEIFNTRQPNREGILYVCSILKIKTRKQKESELCGYIKDKIINKDKTFTDIIYVIKNKRNLTNSEFNNLIVNIILFSLFPYKLSHKSPIPISDKLYNELINTKISNKFLETDSNKLLETSMYIKLCHCITKNLLKDKFKKGILNETNNLNNYSMCTNSIYNQRGIKSPESATNKCSSNFNWYQNEKYEKKTPNKN
jgi:hypothetical protein